MGAGQGRKWVAVAVIVMVGVVAAACSSDSDTTSEGDTTSSSTEVAAKASSVPALFDADALTEEILTVDCTLENGSASKCYSITVRSDPTTVDTGPFCPTTIDSDDSGIFTWDGDNPGLYALDRAFWEMLAGLGYSFVNSDGSVNVSDPAGARPTGDACLQATADGSYTLTALVPVTPENLATPTQLDTVAQVGIALDGVTVFGDAPSGTSGTIPALDPCGGHHDPSGYYHWHFGFVSIQKNLDDAGVNRTCREPQDLEALFGFAFDGYAIYGPREGGATPTDLDACNGHTSKTAQLGPVYHYHLSFESPNLPPCRVGAAAGGKLTSRDNPDVQLPDGGGPGGGGATAGGPPPGQ